MIGTDYELFMKVRGDIIPVPDGLDIGSKRGKHIQLEGGTMHRDNVMVEICPEPTKVAEELVERIESLNHQAEQYLANIIKDDVQLVCEPAVLFQESQLMYDMAHELGCDRDYLASAGNTIARMPINDIALGSTRCGGGHIHMSYGVTEAIHEAIAIHMADFTLGTLDATFGKQGARRQHYGLPGLFRPKKYNRIKGVEYRTPSNLWLASRDKMIAMITNALSLERLLNNEPAKRIHSFIAENWGDFIQRQVLVKEHTEDAHAALATVAHTFPDYDWRIGI